jgi:hypothetical protein
VQRDRHRHLDRGLGRGYGWRAPAPFRRVRRWRRVARPRYVGLRAGGGDGSGGGRTGRRVAEGFPPRKLVGEALLPLAVLALAALLALERSGLGWPEGLVVVAARVWGSLRIGLHCRVGVAPRWEGDSSNPGGAVTAERRAEPCGNPRRRRPRPWGGAQSGEEARRGLGGVNDEVRSRGRRRGGWRVAAGDGGGGERRGGK